MEESRVKQIEEFIANIDDVSIAIPFSIDKNFNLVGEIKVYIQENDGYLNFGVTIFPEYPLKRYSSESITFSNENLIKYSHVMQNGNICIHTSHSVDVFKKLLIDINSLKRWIYKYYINKEKDNHYEHLIVTPTLYRERHSAFLFTEIDYDFSRGEFGYIEYSVIKEGKYKSKPIDNYLVQSFKNKLGKQVGECKWSDSYRRFSRSGGVFIFIEDAPATHGKFIIENWTDLQKYVPQDFFKFLYDVEKRITTKSKGTTMLPLMIGYRISPTEIHWQTTILEIGAFPINHVKEGKQYIGHFENEKINWCITTNSSCQYFIGRGGLSERIAKSKILIIGLGAIGSMVATTLARGGCTRIDVTDFDIKEPENVCRSEYPFISGFNDKVDELCGQLFTISPFVETNILDADALNIYSKALVQFDICKPQMEKLLGDYDIIFDCTTDNDLLYVLSRLALPCLITMSITNKAKDLVCSTELNSYDWVMHQYENILNNDIDDLYEPTGCWSPTFKASYNDIGVLVQYAIKQINLKYLQDSPLRNFTLSIDTTNQFNIKLKEY
jgi:hypothetical protein